MLPISKQLQKTIKGLLVLLVFSSQLAFAAHDGESAGSLHEHSHECVLCLFEGQGDIVPGSAGPVLAASADSDITSAADVAPLTTSPAHFSIRAPPQ